MDGFLSIPTATSAQDSHRPPRLGGRRGAEPASAHHPRNTESLFMTSLLPSLTAHSERSLTGSQTYHPAAPGARKPFQHNGPNALLCCFHPEAPVLQRGLQGTGLVLLSHDSQSVSLPGVSFPDETGT